MTLAMDAAEREAASAELGREPLLAVQGLKTYFKTDTSLFRAVDGVSFSVEAGTTLAIVGCGKARPGR